MIYYIQKLFAKSKGKVLTKFEEKEVTITYHEIILW